MLRRYIPEIVFFSGLWGLSEAFLGDLLYRNDVPFASVPLTVTGIAVLTAAVRYIPISGVCTVTACLAMLYKFFNEPFFACHLLGIVLTGACYDLVRAAARPRSRAIKAAAAVYLSYAAFALLITFVFRYDHWLRAPLAAILRHVTLTGSFAAAGSALIVPCVDQLCGRLEAAFPEAGGHRLAGGIVSLTAAALWAAAIAPLLLRI